MNGGKAQKGAFLFLLPAFIVMTTVWVYPTFYSLFISFQRYSLIQDDIGFVGLSNYFSVFQDPFFWSSLQISMKFAAIAVAIELVLGILIALLLDIENRIMRIVRAVILIPMIITPVVVGLMWRFMFNPELGIIDHIFPTRMGWLGDKKLALYSCAMVDVWQWTPFMFLIIFAGLRSLPVEVREAAIIDGASKLRMLWHITLPLLKRVLLVVTIIRLADALRVFDIIFIMTKGGPILSTDVYGLWIYRTSLKHFHMGYGAAISWIYLAIVAVILFVLLRFAKLEI